MRTPQTLTRTGGTGPFTWATPSVPPAWLTLNSATGQLTGTPTVIAGSTSFTVRVTDSVGGATDDQILTIAVVGAGSVNITTGSLPQATINNAYSQTLAKSGGTAPFTWSLVTLPAGVADTELVHGAAHRHADCGCGCSELHGARDRWRDRASRTTRLLSITVGSTIPTSQGGNGDYYGPCKAFYKSAAADLSKHASAFRRLLDAAGVTSQVQAFCDANGQPESIEDQEFRRLCTSFFSGSNSWRSGGSKVSGLRRLIEAAGSADAVRNFCTTNFGSFTGQECDDDDLHGVHQVSYNSRDNDDDRGKSNNSSNNNGKKKGKD